MLTNKNNKEKDGETKYGLSTSGTCRKQRRRNAGNRASKSDLALSVDMVYERFVEKRLSGAPGAIDIESSRVRAAAVGPQRASDGIKDFSLFWSQFRLALFRLVFGIS